MPYTVASPPPRNTTTLGARTPLASVITPQRNRSGPHRRECARQQLATMPATVASVWRRGESSAHATDEVCGQWHRMLRVLDGGGDGRFDGANHAGLSHVDREESHYGGDGRGWYRVPARSYLGEPAHLRGERGVQPLRGIPPRGR